MFLFIILLWDSLNAFLIFMTPFGGHVTLLNTHHGDVSGATAELELLFCSSKTS